MDDRKRSLSVKTELEAPPLKRQATDIESAGSKSANGFEVPLSQDDVALFKKEAIFRQMQIYRRERDLLQTRVTEIEQRSAYHDDHLRVLELWWDQLLNEVNILSGKPVGSSKTDESPIPKSLLLATSEEYSIHLERKRDSVLQSLTPIFTSLQSLPSNTSTDSKILQESLSELSAQITLLKTENERLRDEREDISRRLTDATFKFMSAEKKLDRLKSSTLAKIERTGMSSPSVKREGSAEEKPEHEKKSEEVDEKVIARIQEESEAVVKKQAEELRQLQEKVVNLTDEISKLNMKLTSISEAEVLNSEPYKTLKVRFEALSTRASHLEVLNDVIKQESEKLSSERTEYRELLTAEYKAMADDLQNQLKKSEQDLIRIRSARDDLLQDLSIRKSKEEQKLIAMKELEELAETRSSRIKTLEMEVERLKSQLETTNGNPTPSPDDSPVELLKRIEKLEKQNQFLSAELPGLETAFNEAHAQSTRKVTEIMEREERMSRLLAEKSKADQKYFSAMRAKEAIALENRALKAQSLKSGEIIQQLRDAEQSVSQKVSTLEKQLAELETVRHAYQKQLQEVQRKCSEQTVSIDGFKAQIEKLQSDLQARSTAILGETDARRQAEEQVERQKVELERWKSESSTSAVNHINGDHSQIEALRSIAICSVCSKNWKNTAIKVCGHCFCFECAKDRLNARLRKCPLCNKQYSHNDLMTIHL
ncbi:BRE1 E3 ubiquitin ligase-domain-containing protein [Lipomyces chichibuensis]|uniref:BRE1 E3 ubiquitin ligase-domain-containing protein n=1 Tax=Lipomyces chichibuensis TaxID=1546026 RepID=UPI003344094E